METAAEVLLPLAAMGVQRLRARADPGLQLKLHAALLAATITNADEQTG